LSQRPLWRRCSDAFGAVAVGGLGKFATTVTRPPPPFEQTVARWQYKSRRALQLAAR